MKNTIEQLHRASQYLAAAGISFVNKASDDSHTNLAWNSSQSRLETHVFGLGMQLAINLESIQMQLLRQGEKVAHIDLQNSKHVDILKWISEQLPKIGIESKYTYEFHYELPYSLIMENHTFTFKVEALSQIADKLNLGQEAFESFLSDNNLDSPIRVWPHHFDLGIYTSLKNDSSFFMGAGLAIPDTLVEDFYFYASGYNKGLAVVTKDLTGLTNGSWRSDWNGATLESSATDKKTVLNFLNEAVKGFLSNA